PGVHHDRQLAASGSDDLALDPHVIAEVDVGLPGVQALLTDLVQGQHDLQVTGLITQRGKAQLAAGAVEHDTARDRDSVAGAGVRFQPLVFLTHAADRRITREGHREGVDARLPQTVQLLAPDPHLFGQVVVGVIVRVVHALDPTPDPGRRRTGRGSASPSPTAPRAQPTLRSKTRRRPMRVSQGSYTSTVSHSSTTVGARPPVATTVTSSGVTVSSVTIRSTIPST